MATVNFSLLIDSILIFKMTKIDAKLATLNFVKSSTTLKL